MHENNPRQDPRHKERGSKKYTYTHEGLAKLLGIEQSTMSKYICEGEFDPSSLLDIIRYYASRNDVTAIPNIGNDKRKSILKEAKALRRLERAKQQRAKKATAQPVVSPKQYPEKSRKEKPKVDTKGLWDD